MNTDPAHAGIYQMNIDQNQTKVSNSEQQTLNRNTSIDNMKVKKIITLADESVP